MDKPDLKETLLARLDVMEVFRDLFPGWEPGRNATCPQAGTVHVSGEDRNPSLSLSDEGKAFCHACGFKATSPVGVVEALEGLGYVESCRWLWDRFVEPLVPETWIAKCHRALLGNPYLLTYLESRRGIGLAVVKRYELGWDGHRLVIPIRNEVGFAVNARRYDLQKKNPDGPKMVSYSEKDQPDRKFGKGRVWPLDQIHKGKTVYVFEGELDTLLAIQHGLPAATVTTGAAVWKDEWSEKFKGCHVVLIPDVDKPGLEGEAKRTAALRKAGVRLAPPIRLPLAGTKDEKDFTDWVMKKGGDPKGLLKLAPKGITPAPELEKANRPADDGLESFAKLSTVEEVNLNRADAAVAWLKARGAFFRNGIGELFYAMAGASPMRVSDKSDGFLALLSQRISKLINPASSCGKFILRHILTIGHHESKETISGSVCFYMNGAIYLSAGDDKILRAQHGKLTMIKNAVNSERILLECPGAFKTFPPMLDADIAQAIELLWQDIGRNIPASTRDQYLILTWICSVFLKEFVGPKPLIRLTASSACGKSTTSKLLSRLLYGAEMLHHSATTAAATYVMAQRYPCLFFDNVETRNMTAAFEDFLMTAATGGMRSKRQIATDSGLVEEGTRCLVLTNGIEPINKRELINRTLEINLSLEKYGRKDFSETRIIEDILHHRPQILAGVIRMMSKYVVPRLHTGEVQRIAQEFSEHSKKRFNEAIGVQCLVLDAIWQFRPAAGYGEPRQMVKEWLSSQNVASQEQDEGTNEVAHFLNVFADRRHMLLDALTPVIKNGDGSTLIKATTRDLFVDFQIMAKQLGRKCPWQNERQLGTRLADAAEILRGNGWTWKRYISNGRQLNEFTKRENGAGAVRGVAPGKVHGPKVRHKGTRP